MRKIMITAAVAATLAGSAVADANAAPATWRIAQRNTLPGEDGITALTVAPTGSTWAGGYRPSGTKRVALVQHLTSRGWTTVASPSGTMSQVDAIAASSSKNVWALQGGLTARAARWNGTRWTLTTVARNFTITDAAALSGSNVWAVGGETAKFAAHWTGRSWHKVTLPAAVNGIGASPGKSLWAVGTYHNQPAVLHWTSSGWQRVKTPTFTLPEPDAYGVLKDVLVLSSKNVWAVGGIEWACGEDGDDTCSKPLILHWNGRGWSSTFGPRSSQSYTRVTSDGGHGIWVLLGGWNPTFVHTTGSTPTSTPAPRPAGRDVYLTALATRGHTVWAGGATFPEGDPDDPTGDGIYLSTE